MEVKFPCEIGDYIYAITLNRSYHTNYVYRHTVKELRVTEQGSYIITNACFHPAIPIALDMRNFGKQFFLTEEEAVNAIGPNYHIEIRRV